MKKLLFVLLLIIICGCNSNSYQTTDNTQKDNTPSPIYTIPDNNKAYTPNFAQLPPEAVYLPNISDMPIKWKLNKYYYNNGYTEKWIYYDISNDFIFEGKNVQVNNMIVKYNPDKIPIGNNYNIFWANRDSSNPFNNDSMFCKNSSYPIINGPFRTTMYTVTCEIRPYIFSSQVVSYDSELTDSLSIAKSFVQVMYNKIYTKQ